MGVPTTTDEIESALAKGTRVSAADLCEEHVETAVNAMVNIVERNGKDNKASSAVVLSASKAIIETSEGRPAVKRGERQDGGLTVVVNIGGGAPTGDSPSEGQQMVIDVTPDLVKKSTENAELLDRTAGPDSDLMEPDVWGDGGQVDIHLED